MSAGFETFNKKAQEVFNFLDKNNDGTLSLEELKLGFEQLKIPVATHEDLFQEFESAQKKHVTKEDFEKYTHKQYQKVKDLFEKMDTHRDFRISIAELAEGLKEFDPSYKYSDDTIKKVFDLVDKNKDGSISFEEWCEFLVLMPKLNIKDVINYWETVITIIDPNEFTLYGIRGTNPHPTTTGFAEIKNWLISLGSGLFAGVVSRTSTAPLERLKLIYQVRYKGAEQPPSLLTGLKEIYKQDGVKGLFRGNLITILRAGPETSIKLAIFEKQTKSMSQSRAGAALGSGDLFFAGAVSGVVAAVLTHPLGVVKTRLAAAPSGTYSGIFDTIKKMARSEGMIRPFFKGLQPTVLAIIPNSGLNLMAYEMLKDAFIGKNPTKEPSTLTFMMIGGISAFASSTLLYPSQIVTSRLVMQGMSKNEPQKGMIGLSKDILRFEGPRGFFKGFIPAMSKIIFGNSISFGCFEFLKKQMGLNLKGKK